MDIASIVKKLVKKYKTSDPFELADYMNIQVQIWPLHDSVKGIYQYFKRNKFIYIARNLTYYEQRIVCGHELGHSVLHHGQNIFFLERKMFCVKNKFEIEANRFAAELLISDDIIKKYNETDLTLEQIAAQEQIYPELIKLKLYK